MKIILKLLLIFLIATNCNQKKNKIEKNNKIEIRTTNNKLIDKELINNVIQNSIKRKRKDENLSFDHKKYLTNKIDFHFVKKYLLNFTTSNDINLKTFFNEYSTYYFYDYLELNDILLFTIMQCDEVGYNNFVHYVLDKKTNKIIDVTFIATFGGDGGHSEDNVLIYDKTGTVLIVKTKSELDEDLFDESNKNCYSRISDIYETKFIFSKKKTQIIELNSITKNDTICN